MKDVTVFEREDATVGLIAWADRDHPTEEEYAPTGAKVVCHTILPYCYLDMLRNMNQAKVAELLKNIIQGSRRKDVLPTVNLCGR